MFYKCSSLKSLDLSSFNTEKVKNIIDMFSGCSSLEIIDLSNSNLQTLNNKTRVFENTLSNLKCITKDKQLLKLLDLK
jgi:surface protein